MGPKRTHPPFGPILRKNEALSARRRADLPCSKGKGRGISDPHRQIIFATLGFLPNILKNGRPRVTRVLQNGPIYG